MWRHLQKWDWSRQTVYLNGHCWLITRPQHHNTWQPSQHRITTPARAQQLDDDGGSRCVASQTSCKFQYLNCYLFNFTKDIDYAYKDHDHHLYTPQWSWQPPQWTTMSVPKPTAVMREGEGRSSRHWVCFFIYLLLHFLYQMFIYAELSVWSKKTTMTTPVLTPQMTVNLSYVQSHYQWQRNSRRVYPGTFFLFSLFIYNCTNIFL